MDTTCRVILSFLVLCFSCLWLQGGCSGGGGNSVSPSSPTIANGVASKGLLNGSQICAYEITGGVQGAKIGCTITDAAGNYTINLGMYVGPVLFQARGGTYVDEATGRQNNLTVTLGSVLPAANGGTVTVAITPLTELAYQAAFTATGGLTSANIQSAITKVQNNFGVTDIINTMPVDVLHVPVDATAAQKTYALVLASFSQYLNSQGTSMAAALKTMKDCLDTPATACGTGATSIGTLLNTHLNTFMATHPALSVTPSPFINLGVLSDNIVLQTVNPLPDITVGQIPLYSQRVVLAIFPPSRYTYSIDTLANGVVPSGMTLDLNGILSGTPFATGRADVNGYQIPHEYIFGVCATDTLSRKTTIPCPQTTITVLPLSITVNRAGTGNGEVTLAPAGNPNGQNSFSGFANGSTLTLTAIPATGSTFSGWGGACASAGMSLTCILKVTKVETVSASFTLASNAQISPSSQPVSSNGGTGSVGVTALNGFTWTATSNVSWISITSGNNGKGNGTVTYTVAANTGTNQRTGTMTIAGQTFTVTQAGTQSCNYTYSNWSACQPNNTQTRTVLSSEPSGCVGTPVLSQACMYVSSCCACYFDVDCKVFGPYGGCWRCRNFNYTGDVCQGVPNGYLTLFPIESCNSQNGCNAERYEVCQ